MSQPTFYHLFSSLSLVVKYLLNNLQNFAVDSSRRSNHALVVGECATDAKVESLAVNISYLATSLADNKVASGMVPDLLLVGSLDRQAQVNVTSATGNGAVLGL